MEDIDRDHLKIALVASSGGHLTQLLKLRSAWQGQDTFYIVTSDMVKEKLGADERVYVSGECNRQNVLKVIKVFLRSLRAIRSERPDVVLSTGAAVGCISCFVGKWFGARIVWVDSITNVNRMSLSGRMVRSIADLCLVQWPSLPQKYKRAEYVGNII